MRDKVSHKYDMWHGEFQGKFAVLLSSHVKKLRETMASSRSQLEGIGLDNLAQADVVAAFQHVNGAQSSVRRRSCFRVPITVPCAVCEFGRVSLLFVTAATANVARNVSSRHRVNSAVCSSHLWYMYMYFDAAQIPRWHNKWQSFRDGEKLLQRQRFPLPADWLHVSNLEGEFQAVEQAAAKKSSELEAKMPLLRSSAMERHNALNDAFKRFMEDWERERCVAALPDAVLCRAVPLVVRTHVSVVPPIESFLLSVKSAGRWSLVAAVRAVPPAAP